MSGRKRKSGSGPYIPDVYGIKKKKAPVMDTEIDPDFEVPSDTLVALNVHRSLFKSNTYPFPPIVLKSHVLFSVRDIGEVEKDLMQLESRKTVKLFSIQTRIFSEEFAIIFIDDYKGIIEGAKSEANDKDQKILQHFFEKVILGNHELFVNSANLKEQLGVKNEKDMNILTHNSLIVKRDNQSYWLCFPYAGLFSKYLSQSRDMIIKYIKRKDYNEVMQAEVESKPFKNIKFPPTYVIKEMIGSGILKREKISSGYILRLGINAPVNL